MGLFKDRINISADYYRNRTGNQLVGYALPSITGFLNIQANLPAIVQNSGFELGLNTTNIRTKNFSWNSSFNLTVPRNKLVDYPNLAGSSYKNLYAIGQSLFIKKQYHFTGVDPQTGLYTFEDVNKDGLINSANDQQFLKQIAKNYFGGLQNSFSYKGWQLDIFFQFVQQTGPNYISKLGVFPGQANLNVPTFVLNAWQKQGDNSLIQRYTTGGAAVTAYASYIASDAIISDASFIRLKNLSLSYTVPQEWLHIMHFKEAKVYLQCQNLFTITKYQGLDPENQGLSLPPIKVITAGIKMSL